MCKKIDSDPFSGFQHGFRSSRCTVDLLAVVSHRIPWVFISYRDTDDTAFNIPKASDRIWHTGLLPKLKSYGISCLNWIWALKLSILLNCLQENCSLDWFCEISFS